MQENSFEIVTKAHETNGKSGRGEQGEGLWLWKQLFTEEEMLSASLHLTVQTGSINLPSVCTHY